MKKIVALLLVVAMLFSIATIAITGDHEPVTIEFLCWGAAETTTAPAFTAMIEGFMAKYPWITIEVTESNYDGVNTSLLTRVASGDAPDVAQVSNQWVATYVEMDGVVPLEEFFDETTIADFYTGSMEGTFIDGKHYSAAWIMQPFGLYCNMDLLAAAGYDHFPTTWDEYIQMARDVAKLGTNPEGNTVYGITLGTQVLANAGYGILPYIWAHGAEFFGKDGSIAFNSKETVAAYTEIQDLVKEGVIATGLQVVDNRSLFGNGQVAFHIDAPSQVINFANVNLAVANIPETSTITSDHHICVFKGTEHPVECAMLVDYLTGPEGMDLYTQNNSVICARHSVEALPYFQNVEGTTADFYKMAPIAKSLPVQTSSFVAAMEAIATGIQSLTIGLEDPASVVATTAAALEDFYK